MSGFDQPISLRQTRAILAELGHRPRKWLGQNFLVDGNIVRKSLSLAQVVAGDRIVEIGPGLGTLTRALLGCGARVWAVESDPVLHRLLATTLAPAAEGRLDLVEGDAVAFPLAGLPAEQSRDGFKVVANLPYAIATPWMDALLAASLPERMVLMVQKEAADRYFASPGTKRFGAISIYLQSAYRRRMGHAVARSCFYPPPEVDSVLMHLERLEEPFLFSGETKRRIRRCFTQRRKQIGRISRDDPAILTWIAACADLGVTPATRPEAIPLEAWRRLEGAACQPHDGAED